MTTTSKSATCDATFRSTVVADMVILPDPGEPPDKHRRRAGINNDADHTPTAWGRSPQYIPVSALTYPSGTPTAEDGPRHAEGTVPVRPRGAPASRIGMQHTMRAATPKQGPGGGHAAMTSFVGRRRELAEAKARMTESRLVTLTGPGGVGKTRMALELAERSRKAFRDGVWIIELASLEDGSGMASIVASALAVTDQSNRPTVEKLIHHLRERQLLLVLDNCEHLLQASAALVAQLLGEAPGLRVLATSREPLAIAGEHICVIPPLSTPSPDQSHTPQGIDHFEAVKLLIDRARSIQPDFTVTDENLAAVVQLCHRLDGIPLAIELAATRLRVLSVTQIVNRLDKRFRLLAGGSRVALPRQQTLRALIDWSYELCTENERLLWARLAVFPGSFDLDAAEQICGFGNLDRELVVDLLDRLIAKSILSTERSGENLRYRQLMTVREYGAELLENSGDHALLKRRHRDHYLSAAAIMVERWCGPGQADALATMRRDHANLVSALEWSVQTDGEIGPGAELAALLRYHWIAGGFLSDGRRWLDQILDTLDRAPGATDHSGPERGEALWVAAWIALLQGDRAEAAGYLSACRELDTEDRMHAAAGDTASVLLATFQLAMAQTYDGRLDTALHTCSDALDLSSKHGERWTYAYSLWITGLCRWHLGELKSAEQAARRALELQRDFQDGICTALNIELLSWIAASASDFQRAARLRSAATAVWTGLGTTVDAFGPHIDADATRSAELVHEALGPKRSAELAAERVCLTKDEAIALALGSARTPDTVVPTKTPPVETSPLTRREREIADLVAEGLSNRGIEESLVISQSTVDGHVDRVVGGQPCGSGGRDLNRHPTADRGRSVMRNTVQECFVESGCAMTQPSDRHAAKVIGVTVAAAVGGFLF